MISFPKLSTWSPSHLFFNLLIWFRPFFFFFYQSQRLLLPISLPDFLLAVHVYHWTLLYALQLLPAFYLHCYYLIIFLRLLVLVLLSWHWLLFLMLQKTQVNVFQFVILSLLSPCRLWIQLTWNFCLPAIQASVWWSDFTRTELCLSVQFFWQFLCFCESTNIVFVHF